MDPAPARLIDGVSFQRESCSVLWDEILPLLKAHWREIAHYQDIPLAVNVDAYEGAEAAGLLRCYTARKDGALIGYAVFFVRHNIHYSGSLQAVQDVLFVAAEHRKSRIGLHLIAYADERLRADGVQVVLQHVKAAHNFGPLLERQGYEHVEHIYAKRLDR